MIKDLMKAMTGSDARPFGGLTDNQLMDGKKKYIADKKLPIVVKGGMNSPSANGAKAYDFVKQEIDAGEDVELLVGWPGGGAHWVTVIGYGKDGAKLTLEVNDPDDNKTGPVDWTITAAGAVTAPKAATVWWAVSESFSSPWDWTPPAAGGVWASAGNWGGAGFPDSLGDMAFFGDGTAFSVGPVIVNGGRTINTMVIDHTGAGSYVITPAGPTAFLQLEDGYGDGSILHNSATIDYIDTPLRAVHDIDVRSYHAAGELHLGGSITAEALRTGGDGTIFIDTTNGSPSSRTLDIEVDADGSTIMTRGQHLDTVIVRRGGLTSALPPAEVIDVEIIALNLVSVNPINVKVDITDDKWIVRSMDVGSWNGSNYTSVSGMIESGRNGGMWDGNGIVTSMTDATSGSGYTGIGIARASEVKGIGPLDTDIWGGQTVTGTDALFMYTYGGDANLSGFVDIDDYGQIDFNAAIGGILDGWFNGDFDYSGAVDIDDYGIIDFVVGIQGAPFPTSGVLRSAIAVPEPAACGFAGLATLLLRRRHRTHKSTRNLP
jgi:hypothetical protein